MSVKPRRVVVSSNKCKGAISSVGTIIGGDLFGPMPRSWCRYEAISNGCWKPEAGTCQLQAFCVKETDEVEKQSCFVRLTAPAAQRPLGESLELFPIKADAALSPRKVIGSGMRIVAKGVSEWLQVVKRLKTCLVRCCLMSLSFRGLVKELVQILLIEDLEKTSQVISF